MFAGTGTFGSQDGSAQPGPGDQATFYRPNGISASVTGDTLYLNQSTRVVGGTQLHPNVVRMITGVHGTFNAQEGEDLGQDLELHPVRPSPARGRAGVAFELAEPGHVSLAIVDLLGRHLRDVLVGEARTHGPHTLDLDLDGLASGVYRVTLTAISASGKGTRATRSLVVIR